MRYILRQREIVPDDWAYPDEHPREGAPLIVALSELRSAASPWHAWRGPLGVFLGPAAAVEELAGELPRLGLVAVEFPTVGDGRGYSQGRLLRTRLGFTGELRAVGAGVRQDQVFLMARCGFDSLQLAPGEDLHAAQRALTRFSVAYQPGAAGVPLERQRFFSL